MEDQKQQFAKNLTTILQERGLTIREVAERMALSSGCVWKWCHGESFPEWENLGRLAEILEIPPGKLLWNRAAPPEKSRRDFRFADIAPCLDGSRGEECAGCRMIVCRIVERRQIACSQCIRRKDCMNCRKIRPKTYKLAA